MREDLYLLFLEDKCFCARLKMGVLFAKVRVLDFLADLFLEGKVRALSVVELALLEQTSTSLGSKVYLFADKDLPSLGGR